MCCIWVHEDALSLQIATTVDKELCGRRASTLVVSRKHCQTPFRTEGTGSGHARLSSWSPHPEASRTHCRSFSQYYCFPVITVPTFLPSPSSPHLPHLPPLPPLISLPPPPSPAGSSQDFSCNQLIFYVFHWRHLTTCQAIPQTL